MDHQILLQKLCENGIRGFAHNWYELYLSNRQQFVFTSGSSLEMMLIKHGVLQEPTCFISTM